MRRVQRKKVLAAFLIAGVFLSLLTPGVMASEEMPAASLVEECIPLPEEALSEEAPVTDAAADEPAPEEIPAEEEAPVEDLSGEEAPAEDSYACEYWINPLYADRVTLEDLPRIDGVVLDGAAPSFSSAQELAQYLRDGIVAREEYISFSYSGDMETVKKLLFVHTGDPKEGDSITYQLGGWSMSGSMLAPLYYTTAAQEEALDEEVERLKTTLSLPRASAYDTVKAVHDYLCDTVTYTEDYKAAEAMGDMTHYTTWGALVNRDCVCQGYSLAMYRLLLECGIDCRVIAGGAHAWNIVKLGNLYYSVDATWDAGGWEDYYFLRGSEVFYQDHTPETDAFFNDISFSNLAFWRDYPLSETDYDPQNPGGTPPEEDDDDEPSGIVITAALFPDEFFLDYVKENLDVSQDGRLSFEEIEAVQRLELSDMGILNLTGVSLFTELRILKCSNNYIGELDVSGLLHLEYLEVSGNLLESLTLGEKDSLYALYCENNRLEELDLTGCPMLQNLWCEGNNMDVVDVSPCPALAALVEYVEPDTYDYVYYCCEFEDGDWWDLSTDIGVMIYTRELLGDVNGDGYINRADAILVLMHTVGTGTLTGEAARQADVNYNEVINTRDAVQILRHENSLASVIGRTAP